jgi:glycosyltransferase involved in cell wall biosynthesis
MPLVSVLTPEYAPTSNYMEETIAGVAGQELPPGWELEWVVQEDGDNPELRERYEDLDMVRYEANGSQEGVATTRNLALGRVAGELVRVLDHDDVLLPHDLSTLIEAFENNDIGWAVGQADDLLPDGRRRPYPSTLPYGIVGTGEVNDLASINKGNWPVLCSGLMLRTDMLRAVGGWAPVEADDDVAMFAVLSELAEGYNAPQVTWLYRISEEQQSRTDTWRSKSLEGRTYAMRMAAAIRAIRTGTHTSPELMVEIGPPVKG